MLIKALLLCLGFVSAASLLSADQENARQRISGVWASEGEKWAIQETTDNKVHITHTRGSETLADFECNSMGRECAMKEDGKHAKVSIWFSGPKLVVLETKGSDILKRRFAAGKDDNQLQMEMIPIVPPGQPQTVQLQRVVATTAESRP